MATIQSNRGRVLLKLTAFLLAFLFILTSPAPVFAIQAQTTNTPLAKKTLQAKADINSGALTFEYPIEVPSGRNGLTPDLSLKYSSQNLSDQSIVGYGWNVSIPSITRANKHGSNELYSGTYKDFISSLDGDLVQTASAGTSNHDEGTYAEQIDNGNFSKFGYANRIWKVTDKDGTVYTYGATVLEREDDAANASHIYKWMLSEVRDTNDNFITYTYFKDAGQIYPDTIKYTGNGANNGIFQVSFSRELQSNIPSNSSSGFLVNTNYRIKDIIISINSADTKKYHLSYSAGQNTMRAMLGSMGATDISTGLTLTTSFSYTTNRNTPSSALGFSDVMGGGVPISNCSIGIATSVSCGARFADINGDGLVDYIASASKMTSWGTVTLDYNERIAIYFNTGTGFVDSGWSLPTRTINANLSPGSSVPQHYTFVDIAPSGSEINNFLSLVDLNNDGRADLIWQDLTCIHSSSNSCNNSTAWRVYLNTGTGWEYSSTWSLPHGKTIIGGQDYYLDSQLAQFVDVNGDGYVDMYENTDTVGYKLLLNNHSGGWIDSTNTWNIDTSAGIPEWQPLTQVEWAGDSGHTRFVDINRDGLPDIVVSLRVDHFQSGSKIPRPRGSLTTTGEWQYVYMNTGHSWKYDPSAPQFPANNLQFSLQRISYPTSHASHVVFAGMDDRINTPLYSQVYVNNFFDFDGDGLPDFNDAGNIYTSQNNLSWVLDNKFSDVWNSHPTPYIISEGPFPGASSTPVLDMNGDGIADYLSDYYNNWPLPTKYINKNITADMLSSVTLPTGGDISIAYKPAAQYVDASNKLLNPALSTTLQTVKSITTRDSVGAISSTINYSYSGGKFYTSDPFNNKFAGFHSVAETDAAGNNTVTYYHQGDSNDSGTFEANDSYAKIGLPYRTEKFDSSGNLFDREIIVWDSFNIGTNHDFVKKAKEVSMQYDGDLTHKDNVVSYTYDNANGNLTQKVEYGEVIANDDGRFTDIGADNFTTSYAYASNIAANILSLPDDVFVTDHNGAKVKESKYYYDALGFGNVTKGNQTKEESWKTGAEYINTQKTYNIYGLVNSSTDPRGYVTSYGYDSFNLYPAIITNPLNQSTNLTYDYASGKITQKTDPNGRVFQYAYDGIGRLLTEKQPDLTTPSTLVAKTSYSYTDTPNYVAVHKTDYLDSNISVNNYAYFDGLDRKIQEKKQAEGGQYETKDYIYNNRGLLEKESLPYFSSSASRTSPTISTTLYTNYSYDPLQRVSTIVNGAGSTTNAYSDWKLTTTDADGKTKDMYKDAYGNLVQVDEHNAGNIYTTNYVYDYLGGLTNITDALSNVRNFTYDGLGRRLTAEDLHGPSDATFGKYVYTYDDAGNLTQVVDPNNQTINYTYDNLNRQLTEDYTGTDGTEVTNTYDLGTDGIGRLTGIITSALTQTNIYNSLGGLASESKIIDSKNYTTAYDYDRRGYQTFITNPDGSQVKYIYNSAGLLESTQRKENTDADFNDVISGYDYSPSEQPIIITYANGSITTNSYDAAQLYRLISKVTTIAGGSHAQDLSYTYDPVGNITQIIDASNTDTSKTANYTYDDLYRLTQAAIANVASGQSAYTHSYSYDAIGNILTRAETRGTDPATTYTYSYEGNSGVNYANPHAVTSISDGINTTAFTYDNNGNELTKGIELTNTWDYNNRLIKVIAGDKTDVYSYDPSGQRITSSNTKHAVIATPPPVLPDPAPIAPLPDFAPISLSLLDPTPSGSDISDSVAHLAPAIVFSGGIDGVAASATIAIPAGLVANATDHSVIIDGTTIDLGISALTANEVAATIALNPFSGKDYKVTNANGSPILIFTKKARGEIGNGELKIEDTDYGAKAQVATFTPVSVTAGETFRATINGTNYDYFINSGDTAGTVVSSLAPMMDANPAVGCSAGGINITCTARNAGTIFTFNSSVIAPVISVPSNPAPVSPSPPAALSVKTLIIGGGGGGIYGGGGGGGYQFRDTFTVSPQTYSVVVGAGGAPYANGFNSSFSTITAFGGGGGGYNYGSSGGSGGGAGTSQGSAFGTGSQGGNGGPSYIGGRTIFWAFGAGGGAGGNGGVASIGQGGNGGAGIINSISGAAVFYSGGGGGSAVGYTAGTGGIGGGGNGSVLYNPGTSGVANTGGGGGGAPGGTPGAGGSGVVIISYPTGSLTATGGTITTSGGNTIHTFTSSGTFTVIDNRTVPRANTLAMSSLTAFSGTGNANISTDGGAAISERGVVISTNANPTTSDTKFISTGTTGTFSSEITGLSPRTLYHVRAYAINYFGTGYGSDVTFTTPQKDIFMPSQTVANVAASSLPATNFTGGADGVAASGTTTIQASLATNANDHSITIDGVIIDLGTSALTPAEIATKISEADFSTGISYVRDGAYTVRNNDTDTLTFTRTTPDTTGNVDLTISDGDYTISNAVVTPPPPPDPAPSPTPQDPVPVPPLAPDLVPNPPAPAPIPDAPTLGPETSAPSPDASPATGAGDIISTSILRHGTSAYIREALEVIAPTPEIPAPLVPLEPVPENPAPNPDTPSVSSTITLPAPSSVPQVPSSSSADTAITTIYATKFYNTDGTTATKHVFVNGVEVGTVTGTGAEAVPRYTHTDQLTGSNIVTNSSDTLDETLDYFPFGSIRIDSGSYSDQRKYIGQEFDTDTGLSYLNARYYDGNGGKFISEDPSFLSIGDENQIKANVGKAQNEVLLNPQSLNSYAYANNNPINKLDPNGRQAVPANPWVLAAMMLFAPNQTSYDPVYEQPEYQAQNNPNNKLMSLTMGFIFQGEGDVNVSGQLVKTSALVEHDGVMKPFYRNGSTFNARYGPYKDVVTDPETGLVNPTNSTGKFQGISGHVDPNHPNVAGNPYLVTELPKGLQANASPSGHVSIFPGQPTAPSILQSLYNIIKSVKISK